MKKTTYLKMITMVKKIYRVILTVICFIVLAIMIVPAFILTLSTGTDGELTWMNFAGLAWLIGLAIFWKMQSR